MCTLAESSPTPLSGASEAASGSATAQEDIPIITTGVNKLESPFLLEDPEAIPEAPLILEGPIRHVSVDHVSGYMKPLYTRKWGINGTQLTITRGGMKYTRWVPQLSKGFSFDSDFTSREFLAAVQKLSKNQNVSHLQNLLLCIY